MMNQPLIQKSTISFLSSDTDCAVDLYLPKDSSGRLPRIAMGHCFSGIKDFAIPVFVYQFAKNGLAAFVVCNFRPRVKLKNKH